MSLTQPIKHKLDTLIQFLIWVDLTIMVLYFLSDQFGVSFPFPLPGKKLNNPLALLLLLFSIRLILNVPFRERHLGTLNRLLTGSPHRFYFFAFLIAVESALQIMGFTYPNDFHWDLDIERGYGTYFSAIQLYILGLSVLTIASEKRGVLNPVPKLYEWRIVAFLFMYLSVDECIGIHDHHDARHMLINFLPHREVFGYLPLWIWVYSPMILVTVIFLTRFFIRASENNLKARLAFLAGLSSWVTALILEARVGILPRLLSSDLLVAMEEGAEMLGATLLLLGFSIYLKKMVRY